MKLKCNFLYPSINPNQKNQMEETDINKELLTKTWSGSSVSEREGQAWDKKKEMDFTYTNIDKFIRYSLGENPVFSNAMYLGDFSISLEEAQRRKHEFVTKALDIKPGSRVLDLGWMS
jgi:cyclopropane-fatty-acyl-phospholipid synthase